MMEELFGRLVLFLFLAGMVATITTPFFILMLTINRQLDSAPINAFCATNAVNCASAILYALCVTILTVASLILLMLKIWSELKRLDNKQKETLKQKPLTIDERRRGLVTVAGRLATIKAAIDTGSHITVKTYHFDAKDAYLSRRLYVNLVDFKAEMEFEGQDALIAWEDLKAYIPRINQTSVLRTSDKLEFNPDHIQLGDNQ